MLATYLQPQTTTVSFSTRQLNQKRVNSVRFNWFVLGALCGIGFSFLLNQLVNHGIYIANLPAPASKQGREIELAVSNSAPSDEMPHAKPSSLVEEQTPPLPTPNKTVSTLPNGYAQIDRTIERGDTLLDILVAESIPHEDATDIISALRRTYNPRNLKIGQAVSMEVMPQRDNATPQLASLSIALDPIRHIRLERLPGGSYMAHKKEKELKPELTLAGGTIRSSLFETGYAQGVPTGVLAEIVKAFSYDIDFQREIQRGDEMEILYEQLKTEDGDIGGHGKVKYAMLKLRNKPIRIYHYEKNGFSGYFNEKGESIIKALLRTPIEGARISSGFGMRRHPILGFTRMHRGADFAAPTGTPIFAAGDGIITHMGLNGAYGNYVKIQHNNGYATAYAHVSRFGRSVHRGKRVRQGDIIAYVGSTGRSTGPHLHYEVHKHGTQINPLQAKFKTGTILQGRQLAAFKQHIANVNRQIAALPRTTKIAQAN